MTKAEEIASVLNIDPVKVSVSDAKEVNGEIEFGVFAMINGREPTSEELNQINHILYPDDSFQKQIEDAFEKIATAIEETPPENRAELAQKIKDSKPKFK